VCRRSRRYFSAVENGWRELGTPYDDNRLMRILLFLAAFLIAAPSLRAETAYPMLMTIQPIAAQVGQASEHTVHSRYSLAGAYQVLISGSGVAGEIIPQEMKPDEAKNQEKQSARVRFTVAADASPGVRDVRIATPRGVSTVGQLVIARDGVIAESDNNDKPNQPQAVNLPATLCGGIEKAEDVDWFRFHVDAPTNMVFHVRCARLQDRIHDLQSHADPLLTLRAADGRVLAASDNHFFADPLVVWRFDQPGDYLLEMRDVRFEGNQYWQYSIEASARPLVETVFPLAVAKGQPAAVEPAGHFLPQPLVAFSLPTETLLGRTEFALPLGGDKSNPVGMFVTDLPLIAETGENNTFDKAQKVTVPCGINGRMEAADDLDCFAFAAKKGEAFSFEIVGRRLQSSLDSQLRILNDKGQSLANNDDLRLGKRSSTDSWLENWTAPADGQFVVEVRDVHLRGGSAFPYFLKITRCQPYFELYLDTDKTQIAAGTCGVMFVRVERKCGFTGEVQLSVDGLPEGVTASCGRILADKGQDGCILFSSAEGTTPRVANIKVTGAGVVALPDGTSQTLTVLAQPYQETYQPGGGRGHWPVETHTLSVNEPADVRGITLSEYDVVLKPGESRKIDVTIERAPEFNANVTLDVLFQHLASPFANTLPPGVTIDEKDVKTLLASGATQGHITLKAAADAPAMEKQQCCLMAHVSLNFVMKATYASKPLTVSVRP